jgi:hypothetical protein
MDEKELYIKDNEASRAELDEAIDKYLMDYGSTCHDLADSRDREYCRRSKEELDALLDILYARLYLAECPF